jgi:hypothetical protein
VADDTAAMAEPIRRIGLTCEVHLSQKSARLENLILLSDRKLRLPMENVWFRYGRIPRQSIGKHLMELNSMRALKATAEQHFLLIDTLRCRK